MKFCTNCKIEKPLSDFPRNRRAKDGFHYQCKRCMKIRNGNWKKNNPDKVREYNQADHARRGEDRKKQMRQHYYANYEQCRKRNAEWQRENRGIMNAINSRRNAAKLQATPAWANQEKIAEFYFAADFLGMVTGEWYQVDHIVPIRSKLVCGLHCEQNLQVLQAIENMSKGNRFWPDMP